ncbi:MAG: hypothetical protein ACJ761_08985 [Chloroflexota bacterium]
MSAGWAVGAELGGLAEAAALEGDSAGSTEGVEALGAVDGAVEGEAGASLGIESGWRVTIGAEPGPPLQATTASATPEIARARTKDSERWAVMVEAPIRF